MFNLELELTKSCNLACKYCFEQHKQKDSIGIEELIQRVDFALKRAQFLKIKDINIDFTGGEPLLQFHIIKEIIHYCDTYCGDYQFQYGIVTNGTLFTEEVKDYCNEHDIAVNLSLDGAEQTQNRNRVLRGGTGSYQKVHENIQNFLECKAPVVVNSVISKNAIQEVYYNFLHILNLGFRRIRTVIDFMDEWNREDLKKLSEQFEKCADYYFQKNRDGFQVYWNFIEDGLEHLLNKHEHYFCGSGIVSFLIDTEGVIHNCSICEEDDFSCIGTVKEGIWEERLKEWGNYHRCLEEKCQNCDINTFCSQCDCVFLNKKISGEYHIVPEQYCQLMNIQYRLCRQMISRMKEYKNYRRC